MSDVTPTHLGSVKEKSTKTLRVLLKDQDGVAVNPGSITDIKIAIRDLRTDAVVLAATSVYPSGGGAVSLAGYFTYPLASAHAASLSANKVQKRLVTLDVTFTDGRLTEELTFDVISLIDIA